MVNVFPTNRSAAILTLNRTNTFSFGSSSHATIHKKIPLYYGSMAVLDAHPCWVFLQNWGMSTIDHSEQSC